MNLFYTFSMAVLGLVIAGALSSSLGIWSFLFIVLTPLLGWSLIRLAERGDG